MINVDELSEHELKEALKKKEKQKQKSREAYKDLCNQCVNDIVKDLQIVSLAMSMAKLNAYQDLKALLDAKQEAYGIKDDQQSHTFSDDNKNSITYGYRVIDDWDDTVTAGISKINEFLKSLATNEDTAKLVNAVNRLLKRDSKGNLKASRVLELGKLAEDFNDAEFSDGVEIIQKSYKPVRSAWFIEVNTTNEQGKKCSVPLSMSSVEFPDGTVIEELFPVNEEFNSTLV